MTEWSFGSAIYGGAWATLEMRSLFADVPRTRRWLDLLALLAEVQADHGLIPPGGRPGHSGDVPLDRGRRRLSEGMPGRLRSNLPLDFRPDRRRHSPVLRVWP
jgi:hypothetical protein